MVFVRSSARKRARVLDEEKDGEKVIWDDSLDIEGSILQECLRS